jgi:hypothetical protein
MRTRSSTSTAQAIGRTIFCHASVCHKCIALFPIVAFRSAKGRSFAEQKTTL